MRSKLTIRQAIGIILSLLVVCINYSPQMEALRNLPETVQVHAGETYGLSIGWPFTVSSTNESMQVLSSSDESINVVSNLAGETKLTVSAFGVPVKSVAVTVADERILYPGGQSVGVALNTKGVLIVGTSKLSNSTNSPAEAAGLRVGDIILTIDGTEVQSSEHLTELITNHGDGPVIVTYSRAGTNRSTTIQPVRDQLDGRFRIGLWVRSGTAGVGTLSFYDPQTKSYGALGHAISDVDTGVTLPVREGAILKASIVGIRKGEQGNPGELQGSFLRDKIQLGNILINNNYGIYGKTDSAITNPIYPNGLPVGSQSSVHTGEATILTTIEGDEVREYKVEITRVSRQSTASQKSMTIKITDPELLEKTGGVVQGMSGSPIIQDGRIIGAVTHVFVNDPTQGYGVFIEWMLQQAEQM